MCQRQPDYCHCDVCRRYAKPIGDLVSRAVDSVRKSSESFEDVLGGLGPDGWSGVVVPGRHPGSDVGFEGLDTAVVAALEQVLGEGRRTSVRLG